MATEAEYSKIVRNVVGSTLMVQPEDNVIVETWDHGLPLAGEFVHALRALGARPMLLFEHERTFWRSVTELPAEKLGKVGEHEWSAMEKAKHYIFIPGPSDFGRMMKMLPKFRAGVGYNEAWYENAEKFRIKGARLTLGYATKQRANPYHLNPSAWQRMLAKASTANFSSIREAAAKLANLLRGNGKVRITGPKGTELSFRLMNRSPWVDDCVVDEADLNAGNNMVNIPGGEIYVAPDETSVEGSVSFDRPTPSLGSWVEGIKWVFKDGLLTSWSAQRNQAVFRDAFDKAEGNKNRIGTFSIGLNLAVKPGFLQDDYSAGAVTLSLGDNQVAGGLNKTKFSFDGVITKATLTLDGQTIIDQGKLLAK